MPICHAYLFEAKRIQHYIMAGGRLRDLVGGSELVDLLCPTLVDKVCAVVSNDRAGHIRFSRNGGGAFYAFSEDKDALCDFRDLWTLALAHWAPGLDFVQAMGNGDSALAAFDAAREALREAERRPRFDPLRANPFVRRNPRIGAAAVKRHPLPDGEYEAVDAATVNKRELREQHQAARRFHRDVAPERWPRDMEPGSKSATAFPFEGHNHIAVIHADGNGLGQVLRRLQAAVQGHPERLVTLFSDFSSALDEATKGAAAAAVEEVLLTRYPQDGMLPARPIVLGGDDMTIIVRADLALAFAVAFLRAFEVESERALGALRERHAGLDQLPERLSACAGIAYARYSQPFSLTLGVAEALCGRAKASLRGDSGPDAPVMPSGLAFHRLTGAVHDDLDVLLEREMTTLHGQREYTHGLGCYTVRPVDGQPSLDDLCALFAAIKAIPAARPALRGYLGTLYEDDQAAATLYRRWRRRNRTLDEFDRCLEALIGPVGGDHPDHPYAAISADEPLRRHSPLADVLTLAAMEGSGQTGDGDTAEEAR